MTEPAELVRTETPDSVMTWPLVTVLTEPTEFVTTESWVAVMTSGAGITVRVTGLMLEADELSAGHCVRTKFCCTAPLGKSAVKTDSKRPEGRTANLAAPPLNAGLLQVSTRESAKVELISPPLTATNGSTSDPS